LLTQTLMDRGRAAGSASIGAEAARLPILEHMPELRRAANGAVNQKLNRLNILAVFACLVRYSACRDWREALASALGDHQRRVPKRH
jgi:hypothetical protein